ncbi:hypothetical protein OS493_026909 [Desmophyllum pertusum]|uniref:Uncharacterized protein n=1 Tax=Desmophyllum pertusum TaxID=174260 RepID=A0A9X0CPV0_9CNID|nr:hypothetical protein OS493_026909 [Desmophyllum pertusum]
MSYRRGSVLKLRQQHLQLPWQEAVNGRGGAIAPRTQYQLSDTVHYLPRRELTDEDLVKSSGRFGPGTEFNSSRCSCSMIVAGSISSCNYFKVNDVEILALNDVVFLVRNRLEDAASILLVGAMCIMHPVTITTIKEKKRGGKENKIRRNKRRERKKGERGRKGGEEKRGRKKRRKGEEEEKEKGRKEKEGGGKRKGEKGKRKGEKEEERRRKRERGGKGGKEVGRGKEGKNGKRGKRGKRRVRERKEGNQKEKKREKEREEKKESLEKKEVKKNEFDRRHTGQDSVNPSVTVRERDSLKTLSIKSRKTEQRSEPTVKLCDSRLQETEPSGRIGGKMSYRRGSVLKLRQQHLQLPWQEAVNGRGRAIADSGVGKHQQYIMTKSSNAITPSGSSSFSELLVWILSASVCADYFPGMLFCLAVLTNPEERTILLRAVSDNTSHSQQSKFSGGSSESSGGWLICKGNKAAFTDFTTENDEDGRQ